jgi:hypothetical protein
LHSDASNPEIAGHFANRISAFISVVVQELSIRKKDRKKWRILIVYSTRFGFFYFRAKGISDEPGLKVK